MRTNLIINYVASHLEMITSTFNDKKGIERSWNWVRRKNDQKAVMIVTVYDDKIIIIKEYREPINDYEWGFPAGLIEKGESPEATVKRELKEETGLDLEKIIHISPPVYNSSGISNESIYIAFCIATGQINQDLLEPSEDIETYILSIEKIKELIQDTTKKFGAKAYLIMLLIVFVGSIHKTIGKDI